MSGRDDGEFELILGNKQLLSVLFIVVVLLGVFFAMGFLAGRSTGVTTVASGPRQSDRPPLTVDSAGGAGPAAAQPPPPEPQMVPQPRPAQVEPQVAAPVRTEPEKAAPAKAEPPPPAPAKPPAKQPEAQKPPAAGFVQNPPAGNYLQAAATRRADAESMLAYIGGKTGLKGYVAPSPKSAELYRVLIGPLASSEAITAARAKLNDIGVKSPYAVKY
ncbi:MAG: SPOR domain-containing protein [Candidatus Solibacter usitatus]|nr:SPOR domain-containing protein [Candidatus Solibacter usitatus]